MIAVVFVGFIRWESHHPRLLLASPTTYEHDYTFFSSFLLCVSVCVYTACGCPIDQISVSLSLFLLFFSLSSFVSRSREMGIWFVRVTGEDFVLINLYRKKNNK